MKDRTVDDMAKDEKLVEATRAKIKEKNLKRIIERKQKFKTVFLSVAFLGMIVTVISIAHHSIVQEQAEDMAMQVRDQELKEQKLVKQLHRARQIKLMEQAEQAKKLVEQKAEQAQKLAEQDDKFKHWPNVMIIFTGDSYNRGTKFIKKSDKPYIEINLGKRFSSSGYMVTGELAELIRKSGLRFQRHSVAFGAGFTDEDVDITVFEKFINW